MRGLISSHKHTPCYNVSALISDGFNNCVVPKSGDIDSLCDFGIIKRFHITGLELESFMSKDFLMLTQHKSLSVFHMML